MKAIINVERIFHFLIFFFFFITFSLKLNAQNYLESKDLSQFKAEKLTESDLSKLNDRIRNSAITIEGLKNQFLAKKMPVGEYEKLKNMLNNFNISKTQDVLNNPNSSNKAEYDSTTRFRSDEIKNKIFGSELFQNTSTLTFNSNIATPMNYELGPNDLLKLVLFGIQEFAAELKVSNEGSINIQNVGLVKVSGLSIEAATNKIRLLMSRSVYPSLKTGESKLSLTLLNIRTIHVTVIGAVKPGTYNLSSLSTVFSALSLSGGPSSVGSFRNIELVRNNKVYRKVDLYHFILNGDQKDNIGLKDNDVIRIPTYENRVEIRGQVKRPGIFELKPSETFGDILKFSGGFNEIAYSNIVKVIQSNGKELLVKDLKKDEFEFYIPNGGDSFIVSKILNRFQNRVKISGAIYRPDSTYQLINGMRLLDLIAIADGLKDDAFLAGAQIFRIKPNLDKEIINIDLNKAILGDDIQNIYLQREDELFIPSIKNLRDTFDVKILGQVHRPGVYKYADGMTVKDLLIHAHGTTYFANSTIRLYRYFDEDRNLKNAGLPIKVYNLEINADLTFINGTKNIYLKPYDIVSVTKGENNFEQSVVYVGGEIKKEGYYILTENNQKVSDIIKLAGGVKDNAFLNGSSVYRPRIIEDKYYQKDSLGNVIDEIKSIPINLNDILYKGKLISDLILKNNDSIIIPKSINTVSVLGSVVQPTIINFNPKYSIKDYIANAGGLTIDGKKNKFYVQYYNGRIDNSKRFLFFSIKPEIEPGAKIFFIAKEKRETNALSEFFKFTSTISQLAASALTIITLSKILQ